MYNLERTYARVLLFSLESMHVFELCPLLYHLPAADDIVHFLSAKLVGKNLVASNDNRPEPA